MTDRPASESQPSVVRGEAVAGAGYDASDDVDDAVFEDVAFQGAAPVDAPEPGGDAGARASAPISPDQAFEEVSLSDLRGGGASDEPSYSPQDGFRIDFDSDPDPPVSTALVPMSAAPPQLEPASPPPPAVPPVPPPAGGRAEARKTVRDRIRMLRRYRWLILGTMLAGLGLAALYGVLAGPTYTAYSVLLVDAGEPDATTEEGRFANAPGVDDAKVLNQAIVLQQAPQISIETAQGLLDRPEARTLSTVQSAAAAFDVAGVPDASVLAEYLREEVVSVVREGEEVDAIRVEAQAASGPEAALIARLYTDAYLDQSRSSNRGRAGETREILEEQIARREGELDEIESQLAQYLTAENAAGLGAQTQATVSQIGTLQAQLDLARVEAQTSAAELGQLEADLASVPARLDASAAAPSAVETTQLDEDINQLETLIEQIYARNPQFEGNPNAHPDLVRLDAQLRDLRQQRRQLAAQRTDAAVTAGGLDLASPNANGGEYVASLQRQIAQTRAALQGARARAAALQSRLGAARGQLRQVPGQQVTLDQLERQRATTAATLAQLQEEYSGVQLAESTELGFAQVIREVQVPRRPSSPNTALNLLLGGLLGLLGGLAFAFVRHQTDSRARTPDDLTDHGFTVVGTVPDVSAALRGGVQEIDGVRIHPSLVTISRDFAPEAEVFRHLHAGVYAGAGAGAQVLLVSGPDAASGKSLVASNVAVAAAQAGRRVLLVDGDLRTPVVASLFGLGDRPPLGEGPDGTNLVYWSTSVPGLFAMTPRRAAQHPDQRWAPHEVGVLLENLRSAFDLVIVDAPAALTSADATLLAPHADAALLVAEANRTDLDALTQVATEFAHAGLSRLAVVLNRFDPSTTVGFTATAGVRQAA
ncbi:MAG: GNVR domain-containing protein [Bacteroidota bacterium]